MKKSLALIVAVMLLLSLFGCSDKSKADVSGVVDAPDKISTLDEAKISKNPNIRQKSENVNGMCYAITLEEFTHNYNEMLKETGSLDMINPKGWKMLGSPQDDANGTEYQYYYYDADKINLTASVETKTNYIMNIGLGTTMSNFVSIENEKNNSDTILMKSAVMAVAVSGMGIDEVDTIQDIFYRTTFKNTNELWYNGNVYALSMNEDKADSERSTMLFRTFPISEDVKENWGIDEYESYVANATQITTNAN